MQNGKQCNQHQTILSFIKEINIYVQQRDDTTKVHVFPTGRLALYAFEKKRKGVEKK